MTTRPTRCERCGARLPEGGSAQACPRCLLELGFQDVVHTGGGGGAPAAVPPTVEELAPLFPQLEIEECIGQGGMGAVYRARQRKLDRPVALKLLSAAASGDPTFEERFQREARALAALTHPNITSVYDYGEAGGHHFLLMEYVDGANLRQIIRSGELAAREALAMVSQMCAALQYAHDQGIVHRDIKPENVLVDRSGQLKIADFGLAKMAAMAPANAPHLTRTDQAMGTLHYMAPEQVERPLEVDHRADIFSLGVVFYELLTGELPLGRFQAPSQRVDLDARFDAVVMRALEKEPSARYQSASDVKTDVDGLSKKPRRPKLAKVAAAEDPPRRRSTGATLLIVLGIGFLVLFSFGCLGTLFLAFTSGSAARVSSSAAATSATHVEGRANGAAVRAVTSGSTADAAALSPEQEELRRIEREVADRVAELERLAEDSERSASLREEIARLTLRYGELDGDLSELPIGGLAEPGGGAHAASGDG